jgi:hypothetical protein
MKIRTVSEAHLRRSWSRLLDLQLRGYEYRVKRRGKVIASLRRARPTMFSSRRIKQD